MKFEINGNSYRVALVQPVNVGTILLAKDIHIGP